MGVPAKVLEGTQGLACSSSLGLGLCRNLSVLYEEEPQQLWTTKKGRASDHQPRLLLKASFISCLAD